MYVYMTNRFPNKHSFVGVLFIEISRVTNMHRLMYCIFQTLDSIGNDNGERSMWVQVDETTDSAQRYIANIVIGALDRYSTSKPH